MSNSISMQRQSIEHCLALLESSELRPAPDVLANARRGCLTLAWFERRQELTRAIVDLDQKAPGLAELMEVFPSAQIRIEGADGQ